jgi:acrylyl-CoA reductase (NADPH)
MSTFTALLLSKSDDGEVSHEITELDTESLPDGDVTVSVEYSTVNYKDGLAITNSSPVVRQWPMIPGIDLAGTVSTSTHDRFAPGDRVILNGWDVGESHWGGYAQMARLSGDWLVKVPEGLSTEQAMAVGTAGYTAMLAVLALEDHDITPASGPVLVTGAVGGVGSTSIAILAALGYEVHASTGRSEEGDYLRSLGAGEIIERSELSEAGRPIGKARWAGAIDSVGSHTLANVCAQMRPHGCVIACGLAQGMDFPASVAPFILRGITLVGIDSVHESTARREEAWARLASDLDLDTLATITTRVNLSDVPRIAAEILAGKVRGRVVVDVNG